MVLTSAKESTIKQTTILAARYAHTAAAPALSTTYPPPIHHLSTTYPPPILSAKHSSADHAVDPINNTSSVRSTRCNCYPLQNIRFPNDKPLRLDTSRRAAPHTLS
jgi:hypothetical protein